MKYRDRYVNNKKTFFLDERVARALEIVASSLHKTQKEIVESALDFYFDYLVVDKIIDKKT